jgi:hypothetical protein
VKTEKGLELSIYIFFWISVEDLVLTLSIYELSFMDSFESAAKGFIMADILNERIFVGSLFLFQLNNNNV